MADNNSNTSSNNSESETKLSDFGTLKIFDMRPRKSVSNNTINSTNVNQRKFRADRGSFITPG